MPCAVVSQPRAPLFLVVAVLLFALLTPSAPLGNISSAHPVGHSDVSRTAPGVSLSPIPPAGALSPLPSHLRAAPRSSAPPPERTGINGTVYLNGTLQSNDTTLTGGVSVSGTTVTTGYTATTGNATYGPTRVVGTLSIQGNSTSSAPILTTSAGSSIFIDPLLSTSTATMSLVGNIALGNGTDAFNMNSQGATLTVWSNASGGGGIYGVGGGSNINSGSNIQITNYGPSAITINCNIVLVCPISVSAGSTFTPCYPIIGCVSASSSSITWNGPDYFTMQGSVTTSAPGLYAQLPDSHLVVSVPGGQGANFSMTPSQGAPAVTVAGGSGLTPSVGSYGDLLVTNGDDISGNVSVSGIFQADQHVFTDGTFHNLGGLTIQGSLVSHGDQQFPGYLFLGPSFQVDTNPGQNLTVQGILLSDPEPNGSATVSLTGFLAASGTVSIAGNLTQNLSGSTLTGNTTIVGSVVSHGSVLTSGTTQFLGATTATGNLTLPNMFLGGSLSAQGTLTGQGSTDLAGTLTINGTASISNGSFLVNGTTVILGSIFGNKSDSLSGSASLATKWGEDLNLTSTVYMGGVATVYGSVSVQGTVSTSGLSTFTSTSVDLASGLTLQGNAVTQGQVSVVGTTFFSGAVTTSGHASFPGMDLNGIFHLSSSGGSVLAQGTSSVNGVISLLGVLNVVPASQGTPGTFHEIGNSTITGTLNMTGSVVVTGSSTLTTTQGTELSMHGDIQLGVAAQIRGYVNTSGQVVISGSATLGGGSVVIAGYLSEIGNVFSEGNITLTGEALFSGSLNTNGTTRLPGITTVGDFTMTGGTFRLTGTTTLQGSTQATGNVTVNSTGYYVTGSNAINGVTRSVGSFVEQGNSTLVGTATVGPGSSFGSYMKVVGSLDTGVLSLTGTTILPDDTVTFPPGASISGAVSLQGTFTGTGEAVTFSGQSIVVGTVSSSGLPIVSGPIVVTLFGSYFALILGPEFYWFVALLALGVVVGLVELVLLVLGRRKHAFHSKPSSRLRALRLVGLILLLVGILAGVGAGLSLGGSLAAAPSAATAGLVAVAYWIAAVLGTIGVLVWGVSRILIRRERRKMMASYVPPPPQEYYPWPPSESPMAPPESFGSPAPEPTVGQ